MVNSQLQEREREVWGRRWLTRVVSGELISTAAVAAGFLITLSPYAVMCWSSDDFCSHNKRNSAWAFVLLFELTGRHVLQEPGSCRSTCC